MCSKSTEFLLQFRKKARVPTGLRQRLDCAVHKSHAVVAVEQQLVERWFVEWQAPWHEPSLLPIVQA